MDLNTMSLTELQNLRQNIATAVEGKKAEVLNSAREEIAKIVLKAATESGLPIAEVKDFLLGDGRKMPKSTSAPKSPPKYQHPDQPHVTWTGRGRHPSWFAEAIAAGTDPEELLIK